MTATVIRILLFGVFCAGLGMACGLFTGILVQVVRSAGHQGPMNMEVAYRWFGFPAAVIAGLGALVVFTIIEARTARRLLGAR